MEIAAPAVVRVAERFDVPPKRVFDAWLDPTRLGRWMFGPEVRDEQIVRLQLDPRVGGRFSFVVRRAGQEIDHVGRYLAIDRPRRLAFTWGVASDGGDTSRVTIDLTPDADGCRLVLTHEMEPKWAEWADRVAQGWRSIVAGLGPAL